MLTRRTLLGGAVAAGLFGCTSPPPGAAPTTPATTISPSPGPPVPSGQATPGPPPLQSRSAALESRAAGQAAGLLAGAADAKTEKLYTALRDAHADHASAVLGSDPTERVPRAPDAPPVQPVKSTRAQLRATLRNAAKVYEPAAVAASGLDALLWGSLYVAAQGYSNLLAAGGTLAKPPSRRLAPEILTDTGAIQAMVEQLHAMVFGYQLALGQLKVLSAAHRRASSGLAARRALRDRLVVVLIDRNAAVPVAAAAYVPPVRVRNPATSAEVIKRMEMAFRPHCGQWVASAESTRMRRGALAALVQTDGYARAWGAAALVWPGWP